jgi:hypothetical protein
VSEWYWDGLENRLRRDERCAGSSPVDSSIISAYGETDITTDFYSVILGSNPSRQAKNNSTLVGYFFEVELVGYQIADTVALF